MDTLLKAGRAVGNWNAIVETWEQLEEFLSMLRTDHEISSQNGQVLVVSVRVENRGFKLKPGENQICLDSDIDPD